MLALSLGAPGVAAAADDAVVAVDDAATARAESAPAPTSEAPVATPVRRSSPFKVMLRSAVLPGWGQMYNHKPLKAAVVVGGEGYLIYKAWTEFQKEQDAADVGDPISKDEHYNLKVNYIWWAIAVHLLQMADAYVDAHLATFDVEFGPDDAKQAGWAVPGRGTAPAPAARVAVHVRF